MNFSDGLSVSVYKSARGFNGRQRRNNCVKASCLCPAPARLYLPFRLWRTLKLFGLAKFFAVQGAWGSYGKRMKRVNTENFCF